MANPVNIQDYLEDVRRSVGEFERGGWHSVAGDSLYFFNESADQYRDRIDDVLTLYRAEEDDRIVGVQIKGVSKLPPHETAAVMVESGEGGEFSVVLLLFFKLRMKLELPSFTPDPYLEAMRAFSPSVPASPVDRAGEGVLVN